MGLKEIVGETGKKTSALRGFVQETSKYVIFAPGVPVIGTLKGYKHSVDPRDPEKQVIVYTLVVKGQDKTFTSAGKGLATQIGDIEETIGFPVEVEIIRTGEGQNTRYTVKVVE